MHVRDSKNANGPRIAVTPAALPTSWCTRPRADTGAALSTRLRHVGNSPTQVPLSRCMGR
ncbi:DUF397 domain-containing protein [Streptomyces sp. NBC_00076]